MSKGCNNKAGESGDLHNHQKNTLVIVLIINAIMFVVELSAGMVAHSISLIADSLDMLGDALIYGFSLYVISQGPRMKAISAFLKGMIMTAFGLFVLAHAINKIVFPEIPEYSTIGLIGLMALCANVISASLLWRHRSEDINMSSVWLCTRNDIIANIAVLFAAVGVWVTNSGWPDIIVGLTLSALFLGSAFSVLKNSMAEIKAHPA